MGKFLETLRPGPARRAPTDDPAPAAAPPAPAVEDEEEEEEIPFIEVGPRKSMEASASVLATGPAPGAAAPAVTFRPSPAEALPRRPHFAADVVAHHQPDHPVSGQYRELLAAVTPPAAGEAAPVLLLTPACRGPTPSPCCSTSPSPRRERAAAA